LREVHVSRDAGHVGRVEGTVIHRAVAGGGVADHAADCVDSALRKTVARIGASSVQTGRVATAVVVEMTPILALFARLRESIHRGFRDVDVHADLAEGAVGVAPAPGDADAVAVGGISGVGTFFLFAEFSGQTVSVVEADFDATVVHTTFAQRTLRVQVAIGKAEIPDARLTDRTVVVQSSVSVSVSATFLRRPDATVRRIRVAVSRNSAETGRARTDRITVDRITNSVGTAGFLHGARVVDHAGIR